MESMFRKNIIISLLCVFTVFLSNFLIPSQTNGFPKTINYSFYNIWDNLHAEEVFEIRYHNSEFRRRPFVLEFQKLMHDHLDIPYQFSFNLINYLCLYFFFLLLPKLSCAINQDNQNDHYSQFFVLFSLPILCAYYGSMGTYDDIVQYLFLTIFLIFLFRQQHLPAMLAFLLACISRETSFVYFFVIGFHLHLTANRKIWKTILWLLPLIMYIAFISLYLDQQLFDDSKSFLLKRRFTAWRSNFTNLSNFRESTTILLIMLGLPTFFLLKKKHRERSSHYIKIWCNIALLLLFMNAVIVSVSGLIREVRLLFIPYLLIVAIAHSEITNSYNLLRKQWNVISLRWWILILLMSGIIAFSWFTTRTIGTGYLYKIYAFIYFVLFIGLIYLDIEKKKASNTY